MSWSTSDAARLEAYYEAELAIISGAQSYSVDSGQSKKTVTRASLLQVQSQIKALERQRDNAQDDNAGGSGFVSPQVRR